MHQHGFDVIMISADGKELPLALANETCPHIIVPMTRKITPFQDLNCIWQLVKIFRKEKPDIVHTETPKAGLVGMIAAWIAGVKIRIHTVAGLPLMVEKGFKLKVLEFIERLTYGAATHVWPNSDSLKSFILGHKFTPAKKVSVVGLGSSNGVNTVRYNESNLDPAILDEVKASVKYDPNAIYLLFIGRLVRDKGIIELVNVFTSLQKTRPELRLILAGKYERSLDPLPAEIEQQIETNPGIVHISWTDKVEYFMAAAHYFVFPSYREGFPNVLLEAAAMNLPIVCSRIAGNVDIVKHQETGLIFESQDENALQEMLPQALDNRERSVAMAAKLHEVITTNYPREIFWEYMLQAYRNLVNR
ncbi:MAG: hypothetical protein JWQ27_2543 [Ferruginibacter sp.]|nr:hypothetical protein [Ferruginibacter sp.]